MSLYAEYLREKSGDEILETDNGFATYRYVDDYVYIIDIYVKPDFRKSTIASCMADAICKEAKEKGINKLLGSVVPSSKNSTASLKVLLSYGMTLKSSSENFVVFEKEI